MHSPASSRLRLNGRVVDCQRGSVTDASGRTTTLRPQAAEVLSVLATKAGQVVTKDELMEAVWGDIAVTDDSLVQCIAEIRKALADEKHEVIRTLPKRGYVLETETIQDPEKATSIRSALLRAKRRVLGHVRHNVARCGSNSVARCTSRTSPNRSRSTASHLSRRRRGSRSIDGQGASGRYSLRCC